MHGEMSMKTVECDCGFMIRTGADTELVKHVQMHTRDVHNMEVSAADALKMAKPANM